MGHPPCNKLRLKEPPKPIKKNQDLIVKLKVAISPQREAKENSLSVAENEKNGKFMFKKPNRKSIFIRQN